MSGECVLGAALRCSALVRTWLERIRLPKGKEKLNASTGGRAVDFGIACQHEYNAVRAGTNYLYSGYSTQMLASHRAAASA